MVRGGVVTVMGFGWLMALSGCGQEESELETYRALEGIYALRGVENYAGVCDQRQKPTNVRAPEYMIAYVVQRDVPEVQLQMEGCEPLEYCRGLASEVKTHGARLRRSAYMFRHFVYSRVRSGRVDGVELEVTQVDDECAIDLRQFGLHEKDSGVDFTITTREGPRYSEEDDGCIPDPDLEAEWRSWQDNPCLEYEILHGEFAESL